MQSIMQSGIREYAGKNKYWTPSNIGITGSMINNAINNIDEFDASNLLSKNEAESTYAKKSDIPDIPDIPSIQHEKKLIGYVDSDTGKIGYLIYDIPVYYLSNKTIGNKNSQYISLKTPSTITNPCKLIKIRFYAFVTTADSGMKSDWLYDLNCSLTDDPNEPMKGSIHKGFYIANTGTDGKFYSYFDFNEIIYGNPEYLYLHFFYNCNTTNLSTKYKNNKIYIVFDKTSDFCMTVEYIGI